MQTDADMIAEWLLDHEVTVCSEGDGTPSDDIVVFGEWDRRQARVSMTASTAAGWADHYRRLELLARRETMEEQNQPTFPGDLVPVDVFMARGRG